MLIVWDYVSMATVAAFVYPVIRAVETCDTRYIWMCVGVVIADYTTKLIKYITRDSNIAELKRPADASNCDFFCRNGGCGGNPGFPSGHMTIVSFFFAFLFLLGTFHNKALFVSLAIICILMVALARYNKRCHTILQILTGTAWGTVAAYAWFHIMISFS
jgi:membrane-associated phospholipid phosphatase